MKQNPERTQTSLAKIQDLLLRNANLNKGSNDQQFRLQKVVTNTAQQVLDKLSGKLIFPSISCDNDTIITSSLCVWSGTKSIR